MGEEKRSPSEVLRRMLDERGINWWTDKYYRDTNTCWRVGDFEWRASEQKDGTLLIGCTCVKYLTPEQVIAATVGNSTDLSKRLREVHGLHEFAELFGFDWTGESDWDWHDVACAMADAVDAATVGAGTCKDLGGTGANGEDVFNCSECGCVLSLYDGEGVNTLCTSFIYDYPRFCPECGARVVSE